MKIAGILIHNEAGHRFDVGSGSCLGPLLERVGCLRREAFNYKHFCCPQRRAMWKTWNDASSNGREQKPMEVCVALCF